VGNDWLPSRTLYEKWTVEIYRSKRFGGVSNLMGEIVAVFVMTVGYT